MYHTKDKTHRLAWIIAVPLMLCLLLSGCSGVKQLEIFKTEVEREKLNLKKPTALELEQLRWIIITSENAEEVFKKLEEQGIDPVLFGLTDKDFEEILAANQKMNELVNALKKDLDDLDKRFYKKNRDFGKLSIEKTEVMERIINKGGEAAKRCIEIASGAELTEQEINATKKSEINRECPSIANPNYVPYQN